MSILPSLSTGLGVEASAPPVEKGLVLIIEDETTIITYLSVLLGRQGWRVLTAQDGRKGIDLFSGSPDKITLAIVDGRLPDLSGEVICSQLRAIDSKLPILFCSGLLETGENVCSQQRTRFLAKPFTPSQLLNEMQGLLSEDGVAI